MLEDVVIALIFGLNFNLELCWALKGLKMASWFYPASGRKSSLPGHILRDFTLHRKDDVPEGMFIEKITEHLFGLFTWDVVLKKL